MKKFILAVFVILAVLLIGVIFARNIIVKSLLEGGIKNSIDQKITIGNVDVGIFEAKARFDKVEIYNPEGYKEKLLADVHELYIKYALADIIKGYVHLPELKIDIKEMNVEKDSAGVLNLEHFAPRTKGAEKKKKEKEEEKFLINKMDLEIDKIRYRDNTKTPPDEKEFDINFKRTFTNVDSINVVISEIKKAAVERLIEKGIKVAIDTVLKNEKFQEALQKGDTKTLKKEGSGMLEKFGKEFFDENK